MVMEPPILCIVRGDSHRLNAREKKLFKTVAKRNCLEVTMINFSKNGTNDMIQLVLEGGYRSVIFRGIASISRTFLYELIFVMTVQEAGVSVYVVDYLTDPPRPRELSREKYKECFRIFQGDMERLLGFHVLNGLLDRFYYAHTS